MRGLSLKRRTNRIERMIAALGYDFSQFELAHFVNHVAQYRRKPIQLYPLSFDQHIQGAWVPGPYHDYIFYNERTHRVHQVHIVLHEIAHMLLNHQRRNLENIFPQELLRQLNVLDANGRLRASLPETMDPEEERESEAFVLWIQRKLVQHERLEELTGESSSIPALKPFTDIMGYSGQ